MPLFAPQQNNGVTYDSNRSFISKRIMLPFELNVSPLGAFFVEYFQFLKQFGLVECSGCRHMVSSLVYCSKATVAHAKSIDVETMYGNDCK